VEGEGGFAGAGQAGEHDKPVARNLEVDVLEIVLARAADGDHAAIAAGRGSVVSSAWFVGAEAVGHVRNGLARRGGACLVSERAGASNIVRTRPFCQCVGRVFGRYSRKSLGGWRIGEWRVANGDVAAARLAAIRNFAIRYSPGSSRRAPCR